MSFNTNTIGYQVANDYLQSSFTLDREKFQSLLSKDVEMQHITDDHNDRVIGRDKVMALYKKKFFDVTSDFDIQEVNIYSNGLQPKFKCKVSENKKEDNQNYRVEIHDQTTLHLVEEEGKWKIKKIIAEVSKKILS